MEPALATQIEALGEEAGWNVLTSIHWPRVDWPPARPAPSSRARASRADDLVFTNQGELERFHTFPRLPGIGLSMTKPLH